MYTVFYCGVACDNFYKYQIKRSNGLLLSRGKIIRQELLYSL